MGEGPWDGGLGVVEAQVQDLRQDISDTAGAAFAATELEPPTVREIGDACRSVLFGRCPIEPHPLRG